MVNDAGGRTMTAEQTITDLTPVAGARVLSTPAYRGSQGGTPRPTTRYLCSAAFLVPGFADKVVRELIGEQVRAVPPSNGFDLDPVLRQCLRARRHHLWRMLAATVLYIVAIKFSVIVTLLFTVLGSLVAFLRSAMLRDFIARFRLGKLGAWAIRLFAIGLPFSAAAAVVELFLTLYKAVSTAGGDGTDTSDTPSAPPIGNHPWLALLTLACIFVVGMLFRRLAYRIVTTELAKGGTPTHPTIHSAAIADRITMIARTQRGNIVVQHDDPFLGNGDVQRGWSLSMTLRPQAPPGKPRPERPIDVDTVALNEHLKQAIKSMRAEWLGDGQQVTGLAVGPMIVADGIRDEADPLIDPETGMPFTLASAEAIDAIVDNAQGGLRQYLRIIIPVRGKAIRDAGGQVILGEQALGISVTAFVHVAVEGGMLYAEFLSTVLPPMRAECRLSDVLRRERITGYALSSSWSTIFVDIVSGPWRLGAAFGRGIGLRWAMMRSRQRAREFRTHDYGARLSVRELASAPDVESFLQELDGIKYVKLVERMVGEAIVDFLVESGVDPLEFRQAVQQVTMQNVSIGTVSGGQNNFGGAGNTFTMTSGGSNG